MVGKEELCALSEEDLMNEATVSRFRNRSGVVFQSLQEIFSKQSKARNLNLSGKRKPVSLQPQVPQVNLQSNPPPPPSTHQN
jgi:hypothetical protein